MSDTPEQTEADAKLKAAVMKIRDDFRCLSALYDHPQRGQISVRHKAWLEVDTAIREAEQC